MKKQKKKEETRGRKPVKNPKVNLTITTKKDKADIIKENNWDRNELFDDGFKNKIEKMHPNYYLEPLDMTGIMFNKLAYRSQTSQRRFSGDNPIGSILYGRMSSTTFVWLVARLITETGQQINRGQDEVDWINKEFPKAVVKAEQLNIPIPYLDIRADFIAGKKIVFEDYLKKEDFKMLRDHNGVPNICRWKDSLVEYPLFVDKNSEHYKKQEAERKQRELDSQNALNRKTQFDLKRIADRKKILAEVGDRLLDNPELLDKILADKTIKKKIGIEDKNKKELEKLEKKYNEIDDKGQKAKPEAKQKIKDELGEIAMKIMTLDPNHKFKRITW